MNYNIEDFMKGSFVAHFTATKLLCEYYTGFLKGFINTYEKTIKDYIKE